MRSDENLNQDQITGSFKFDILIFSKKEDYLCYVEAVHLLYHDKVKKHCDFLLIDTVIKESTSEH